jgi:hypothetical protein
MNKLNEEIQKFKSKSDGIHRNAKIKGSKKKEKIKEALVPVTSFYKNNFVPVEKYHEFFHVEVLMQNGMPKDGAKLYSNLMRLANEKSAETISRYLVTFLHDVKCSNNRNYHEDAMDVFNGYFILAQGMPTDLDLHEMRMAQSGLAKIIGKRTDTNT